MTIDLVPHRLSPKEIAFEIGFAIGQAPASIWVGMRAKDRDTRERARQDLVHLLAARFDALEVNRYYDPDYHPAGRHAGKGAEA